MKEVKESQNVLIFRWYDSTNKTQKTRAAKYSANWWDIKLTNKPPQSTKEKYSEKEIRKIGIFITV